MPIDRNVLPPDSHSAFGVRVDGDTLVIELSQRLDGSSHASLWATDLIRACPGPWPRVVVDCTHLTSLSSSAIAGLVRLADEYTLPHGRKLELIHATDRIRRTIAQIQLDSLLACVSAAN